MPANFAAYARHYDLLYGDKDYGAEAAFVAGLLHEGAAPRSLRILELGSGTGRHARALAALGHTIHGVDLSSEMVERARAELGSAPRDLASRVAFDVGDLRTHREPIRYDAVISLFHVMSYQTEARDFEAGLATARAHLLPGGRFVFDAWYGTGVLTTPPSVRVKRASDASGSVLRLSEPDHHPNENRVDVHFTVFELDRAGAPIGVTRELHRMRYWFHPEVVAAAERNGFRVVRLAEWLTGREPGTGSWNVSWTLQAVS
jgi:SAM-dependent methyltransferase